MQMFGKSRKKRLARVYNGFTVHFAVSKKKKMTHCTFNYFKSLAVCRRLANLARSKKLREQQGKILLEGRRLISDALDAGASPVTVFFSTVERLQELPVDKLARASLVKVKLEDVRIWPDLEAAADTIGNALAVCVKSMTCLPDVLNSMP